MFTVNISNNINNTENCKKENENLAHLDMTNVLPPDTSLYAQPYICT